MAPDHEIWRPGTILVHGTCRWVGRAAPPHDRVDLHDTLGGVIVTLQQASPALIVVDECHVSVTCIGRIHHHYPGPIVAMVGDIDTPTHIALLDAGATLCLPVSLPPDRAFAWIEALMGTAERLARPDPESCLLAGRARFDRVRRVVSRGDVSVRLSHTEAELLSLLMARPGEVLSREYLYQRIWSTRPGSSRALDQRVTRLRARLRPVLPDAIVSAYGRGYALNTPPDRPRVTAPRRTERDPAIVRGAPDAQRARRHRAADRPAG